MNFLKIMLLLYSATWCYRENQSLMHKRNASITALALVMFFVRTQNCSSNLANLSQTTWKHLIYLHQPAMSGTLKYIGYLLQVIKTFLDMFQVFHHYNLLA